MKKFVYLLCLLIICTALQAQEYFTKSTYPYSIKGNQTLSLDLYTAKEAISTTKKPCVIFMFGGAFARGSRDVPKYMPYFDYLVKNGYTVVSIDYRLGLKEASRQQGLSQEQFARQFINAVDIAVEDLFDATRYVLEHAADWNIDPDNIIINGSSAGAVTVLQAEYAVCNNTYNASSKLPAGFNYKGVIAFAGAIFLPHGNLTWIKTPSPIMVFHGDADLQVPYDRLIFGEMGLYGGKAIADSLHDHNYPYYFYKFENYGHEIASNPMQDNKEDILWFLQTLVQDKKQYQIYKDQIELGRTDVNKNFGFEDYVKGNFAR